MQNPIFSQSFLVYALGVTRLRNLTSMYFDASRYYHNYNHIEEMLVVADEYGIQLTDAQYLAILFHDIIYIPGFAHNEAASAQFMRNECVGRINDDIVETAHNMIMLTVNHKAQSSSFQVTEEMLEFMDLDLYRLGSCYNTFLAHTLRVFYEYRPIIQYAKPTYGPKRNFAEFVSARKQFLTEFIKRNNIFLSQKLASLNSQAFENIQKYIAEE